MDHGMRKGGKAKKEKMPYKRGGYQWVAEKAIPVVVRNGKPQRLPMKHGGMQLWFSKRPRKSMSRRCRI